jgi:hypothetical protein
MSEHRFTCLKCGSETSKGFISERGEHHNFIAQWVEGEPKNASLLGLQGVNVDIRGREIFPIRSLRCDRCGFLELYAV